MGMPPTLLIGSTTISATRRLPSQAFQAICKQKLTGVRSQTGKLFTQFLYEKYSVKINGLSQTLYEDLRYEYQRVGFIDLYSIQNRKETFTAAGTTLQFYTTRRIRTDDGNATATVENPPGTFISASYAVSTGGTQGLITLTGGTVIIGAAAVVARYYPIISGQIMEFESTVDWVNNEEIWSLLFEES
jgi:hypothetical protein